MALTLINPPLIEPISLSEAKAHIRIDHDYEDDYIQALIVSVRVRVEAILNRALITQTWEQAADRWPLYGLISLGPSPVQAVELLSVRTPNGPQAIDDTSYELDAASHPARLRLTGSLPCEEGAFNAVLVRFRAGYGDAAQNVPADIRHAMLFMLAHWYEHRDPMFGGETASAVPNAALELLSSYKEQRL